MENKMRKNKLIYLMSIVLALGVLSYGFTPSDKDKNNKLRKPNTNDNSNSISINQCFMWMSNNGSGSHDPRNDGSGFYWPGGENATIPAIFADGLIWGAKIGREVRVNGATYRYGLQAGKILSDGSADDPSFEKYRIFRIRKGWESLPPSAERDAFEKDYNEWPVDDGAPWVDVNGDGIYTQGLDTPEFVGDEVLWCVSNDLDASRTTFTYGTLPMGLEQQTTVFAFNRTGDLGDMVFKKYKLINKGTLTLKDMIIGYWSDTDLGFAGDDYTGCDTVLSLGYTYNGDNDDNGFYGTTPAADGYDFFQGPVVPAGATDSAKFLGGWRKGFKNLPMTAFTFYINNQAFDYPDPDLGVAAGSVQFYNYLSGFRGDGAPFIDPNTGEEVKFVLAGDPVGGTGWYEGPGWPGGPTPDDRRHVMCSGPFDMAPGDTQEVVVGILITRAADPIASIVDLKRKDNAAQIAYNLDFKLTPVPQNPVTSAFTSDAKITLLWEDNAESYDEGDPLIYGFGLDDTTYTFEGYRVWQFSDNAGSDPVLLDVFDLNNNVTEIPDFELLNEGVAHYKIIDFDEINKSPLFNARPYYFAVTVFGYSPNSDPKYLESPPQIITVFPGKPSIDNNYPYNSGDNIVADQTSGNSDSKVTFKIVNPSALTGHDYEVAVGKQNDLLVYSLIDKTLNDTLLANQSDFGVDTLHKQIIDGFILNVENMGGDAIADANNGNYAIKSIEEIKGPGGSELGEPVNVFESLNSTGQWQFQAINPSLAKLDLQGINEKREIGFDDYEIRFTESGSEYYATYFTPIYGLFKNDPKGKGRIPLEIWNIGFNSNHPEQRLYVKIVDNATISQDTSWSQDKFNLWDNSYRWEGLYGVYSDTIPYSEPLPDPSYKAQNSDYKILNLALIGDQPLPGTVVKITTWKPMVEGDKFSAKVEAPLLNNSTEAQNNLNKLSVFPNPYFGAQGLEQNKYARFMRFTGLPTSATIRIVSLAGVFIRKIEKDPTSQYVDWDLFNSSGLPVASGIYLAYIDMPGVGTKILKLAVIQETQYIDRI